MKKMKKIASLMLAVIMVFAMTISVSAAGVYSITVNNTNTSISIDGKTYSAYKLLDVTYAVDGEGTPTGAYSYTVAEAFAEFVYQADGKSYSGEDLVNYIAEFENDAEELNNIAEAALAYAKAESIDADGTATASDQTATIELDTAGYYLVAGDASAATDEEQIVTAACALTTTNPKADVNVKADVPGIDKVIVEADSADVADGYGTAQDVGSVVDFKVTSDVPDMTGYEVYEFIFNDTLSAGLTAVDSADDSDELIDVAVTIGGEAYTDFTVAQNGQSFTVTFNNFIAQKANAGDEIVITYSAVINENALSTDVETNTVNLEYSNNPNNTTSREQTPDEIVYIYDFDIVIDKYAADETEDAADNLRLAGAKFILKNSEGKFYKLEDNVVSWVDAQANATEVTTDENGAASFVGLDTGTYYLVETQAPDGYNKLKQPIEVVITASYNADGTIAGSSAANVEDGQYSQTQGVENNTGILLPTTGGMGTTIFYVIGGIIVAGAAVMLVVRRRIAA